MEQAVYEAVDGTAIKIRVQPRASRNKIAGLYGDAIKVVLTSPPVDGQANQACIEFFADLLSVAKTNVAILAGHKGRNKTVKIYGLTKSAVLAALTGIADRQ